MINYIFKYKEDFQRVSHYLNVHSIPFDFKSRYLTSEAKRKLSGSRIIQIVALISGFVGFIIAILFQYYSAVYYPLNTGDRVEFSLVFSIPFAFEISMLFAGIGAFTAFLLRIKSESQKFSDSDAADIIICSEDYEQQIDTFFVNNNIEYTKGG